MLIFFVSCKKEEESVNLRLESETSSYSIIKYYYNPDGKVKTIKYFSDHLSLVNYFYDKNYIYIVNSIDSIAPFDTTILTLNSKGYVERTYRSIIRYGYKHMGTFRYNADGYLIELSDTTFFDDHIFQMGSYTYSIENGNQAEMKWVNGQDSSVNYTYYTFNTDKANTITNENKGMWFLGKSNNNPISQRVSSSGTSTYTYDFDQNNRIIKSTMTTENSTSSISYVYKF